ncbi:hypothetical protein [Neisseria sp. HMSC31F04]|uniref:hypothetical protein n=1 Tax=Neisseria sp. HMSC31F04 TaxID=1581075 RepID=UPI001438E486|nr:hypothetical protein [Neisseria sp. HMSC31F04]
MPLPIQTEPKQSGGIGNHAAISCNTQIGRLKNQHPVFQMAYFMTDAAGREIRPALCR